MGDVPDQPHPLDADEIAKIKECLGAGSIVWHWSYVARLVATVEAQATRVRELEARLADAHAVIRRLDDSWLDYGGADRPWVWSRRNIRTGCLTDEPMSPGEVDAIKQARETSGWAASSPGTETGLHVVVEKIEHPIPGARDRSSPGTETPETTP